MTPIANYREHQLTPIANYREQKHAQNVENSMSPLRPLRSPLTAATPSPV